MPGSREHPLIIVAPRGQDAPMVSSILEAKGIHTSVCEGLGECVDRITPSTAALLLTEEALEFPQLSRFTDALKSQPEWSELPLIILAAGGERRLATLLELTAAVPGTVRLLERPMHAVTLVNAVQVALRSRWRQYLVRDLLEQQQRYKQELQQALDQRTTELTQTHEAMRRSEAMAVLGALSTGIAHDLGNLLFPLQARLDVLASLPMSPEIRENIQALGKSVEYLKALSGRLRQYMSGSDKDPRAHERFDLAPWCRDTEQFYRGVLPPHVTFRCEVPRNLPALAVNKAGLTQAVYNLVQNAGKAITKSRIGSTVTLRAAPSDGHVAISVEDDGPGMTPDVLRRCVERSFTTDAEGGSMGLGLSLVYGFVESCGGTLEVYSPPRTQQPANADAQPSRGTDFIMRLPVVCSALNEQGESADIVVVRERASAVAQSRDSVEAPR